MKYDSLSVDPRTLGYNEKIVCTPVYYSIEIYGDGFQITPATQPPSGWSRFLRGVGDVLKTAAVEIGSFALGGVQGFIDSLTFGQLPPMSLPVDEQLYQLGKIIGNLVGANAVVILSDNAAAATTLTLLPVVGPAAGAVGVLVSIGGRLYAISGVVQAVENIVELDYIIQQANSSSTLCQLKLYNILG